MLKHCLIVFGVSMVPLIELRGAIPYGIAFGCRCGRPTASPSWATCCRFPLSISSPAKSWPGAATRGISASFLPGACKRAKGAAKSSRKRRAGGLFWALLLFVGIPLPGTGAWTGTLAASILDMGFKKSVLACMGGVLLAGIIMGGLSLLGVGIFTTAAV